MVHNPYMEHYMKVYAAETIQKLLRRYNTIIENEYNWVKAIEVIAIRQQLCLRGVDISSMKDISWWNKHKVSFDEASNSVFIID